MNKFLEVGLSFKPLYELLSYPFYTKLLYTGIELKVFNYLTKFDTADAVAQAIDTHPENTRYFLNALVAIDLLIKKNGQYKNAPIVQKFLVEGVPIYLGKFLTSTSAWYSPVLENMTELIKNGPLQNMEMNPNLSDIWAQNARDGANYQRAGASQLIAGIISKLPEFPSFKKMLDLGGGAGLHGLCIVDAHPSMKGVIFDQPSVVKVAEDFIKEYGMEDRMEVKGGNYMTKSIGEGYDLIFASSTLNFAKHNLNKLFKKIFNALNPGGIFIAFQDGLTDEQTKPASLTLGFLGMTLMGQDFSFSQGEIADAMIRTGFKSVQSRTIDYLFDMDMDIARK